MRFAALLVLLGCLGCARSAPHAADAAADERGATLCRLEPLPLVKPAGFPEYRELYPSSELGRALGRRLFFDPRLSASGKVACASCHDPGHAYSIPEGLPTRGESGRPLARHPPSLLNVAWVASGLFWDGGSKNLESQALGPLLDADELGRADTLPELLSSLRSDAQYRVCFEAVFGPGEITIGSVARALAQFERSLVSASARWDRQERGELERTPLEAAGKRVFERDCARCHTPPLFSDGDYHHIGLDDTYPEPLESEQRGRARITGELRDLGKHRTPSLREVGRSAPYMHDGRYDSLARVIEHYRTGMRESPALDAGFRRADARPGLTLTDDEALGLEAFLRSLE